MVFIVKLNAAYIFVNYEKSWAFFITNSCSTNVLSNILQVITWQKCELFLVVICRGFYVFAAVKKLLILYLSENKDRQYW